MRKLIRTILEWFVEPPTPRRRLVGTALIWGVREFRPIINIPAEVTFHHVFMQPDEPALAMLRFKGGRREEWFITTEDNTLSCPRWKLLKMARYSEPSPGGSGRINYECP